MKLLYRKLKDKSLKPEHVCEVGVYLPETSNILDFINDGVKATLVEADPVTVEHIHSFFKGKNITVYPCAIWDRNGTIRLSKAAASTFVTELHSSPAIENDKYVVKDEDTFEVPCKVFSDIDDGTIDLLSIDIEGSEWYVIKHLKSRPKILSIETHGKYYTNPFMSEINDWIAANGYLVWYKDGSDTVYVRNDIFAPSFFDKLQTFFTDSRLAWKKIKGKMKGAYKG